MTGGGSRGASGPGVPDEGGRPDSRLFGVVMAWTVFTGVFAWLPIVRALARPEGYSWSFFGLRGVGLGGPFWIFALLALYAVTLFAHAWWERRALFRTLLVVWHAGWTALLIYGAFSRPSATWQGQGWGWEVPLLGAAAVFSAFTLAVVWWAIRDRRAREVVDRSGVPEGGQASWTTRNTRRVIAATLLFPLALITFRLGSDYDWVTAVAIGLTIVQWITLYEALAPAPESAAKPTPPRTGLWRTLSRRTRRRRLRGARSRSRRRRSSA